MGHFELPPWSIYREETSDVNSQCSNFKLALAEITICYHILTVQQYARWAAAGG